MDPFAKFKEVARQGWSHFAPLEALTGVAAPHLVRFARVTSGARVLDVGCGTGVVALTAARIGARVTGLDLTPELITRAQENSALMKIEVDWKVGDAEELPFADGSFDFVVSQFGHMFAPRPEIVVREMLRVLAPGGVIAFSTWPPELFTGRMFAIVGKYLPPPAGSTPPAPPPLWGDPSVVRERLGAAVKDLTFARQTMMSPALSPQHSRALLESVGPMMRLATALDATKLAEARGDLEALITEYFENNTLRQDYLMSRAVKI